MKKGILLAFLTVLVFGCSDDSQDVQELGEDNLQSNLSVTEGYNEERNLYFG
ncbi:uncharacterized protein METZ01_LOCUS376482, partial [marine metagenome]